MRIRGFAVLGTMLAAGCAVGETDAAFLGTWRYEPTTAKAGCPGAADRTAAGDTVRLVSGAGAPIVRIQPAGCALWFEVRDGRAEVAPGQVCLSSGIDAAGVAWTEATRPLRWSLVPRAGDQLGETATVERERERGGVVTIERTTCTATLVRVGR